MSDRICSFCMSCRRASCAFAITDYSPIAPRARSSPLREWRSISSRLARPFNPSLSRRSGCVSLASISISVRTASRSVSGWSARFAWQTRLRRPRPHHERPDWPDPHFNLAQESRRAADPLVLCRAVDPEMRICHSQGVY